MLRNCLTWAREAWNYYGRISYHSFQHLSVQCSVPGADPHEWELLEWMSEGTDESAGNAPTPHPTQNGSWQLDLFHLFLLIIQHLSHNQTPHQYALSVSKAGNLQLCFSNPICCFCDHGVATVISDCDANKFKKYAFLLWAMIIGCVQTVLAPDWI